MNNVFEHKNGLILSSEFVGTFLILRRIQRDMTINAPNYLHKVPVICAHFNIP
jgi:hypothetical protein